MIYKVELKYQNIESGGSTKFTVEYNLEAGGYIDAIEIAIQRLNSSLDGKLFSVYAEEIILN